MKLVWCPADRAHQLPDSWQSALSGHICAICTFRLEVEADRAETVSDIVRLQGGNLFLAKVCKNTIALQDPE